MPSIALPRLRTVLLVLLVAAAVYAVVRFYRAPLEGYLEARPAAQDHRPDVFGR